MAQTLSLYWHTLKNMKSSQIYYRFRRQLHMTCSLGISPRVVQGQYHTLPAVLELDLDPVFLSRFVPDDLIAGKMCFLHHTESFDPYGTWKFPECSALWNFNLHYFEFLFPLIHAYKESGSLAYLDKIKALIHGWIVCNPVGDSGHGWAPYTIALRLTNWLSCFSMLEDEFALNKEFADKMLASMYEQYCFLAEHLEKDLLANHYFEDLKALVLSALFFNDGNMLASALQELKKQCQEQILSDGIHFERSPMYHKIILEGLFRVCIALRCTGRGDQELEQFIQPMLDAAYSLEEGLERIPLFNDCGNNVSKSLTALQSAAQTHFKITPRLQSQFPVSGYYIFHRGPWKLIVDAGTPGPKCNPGHAHCDAMSFELFKDGKPVLVNSGTFAYQNELRSFFRSTKAHNTVMANQTEQSQCWSTFRTGKMSRVQVLFVDCQSIKMQMHDQKGHMIQRTISISGDRFKVMDESAGLSLSAFYHFTSHTKQVGPSCWHNNDTGTCEITADKVAVSSHPYATDYGMVSKSCVLCVEGANPISFHFPFPPPI